MTGKSQWSGPSVRWCWQRCVWCLGATRCMALRWRARRRRCWRRKGWMLGAKIQRQTRLETHMQLHPREGTPSRWRETAGTTEHSPTACSPVLVSHEAQPLDLDQDSR
ncbi:hypothetical protein C8R46DRAFT_1056610 [Mycena filopes]|nr:hypothetical protein C8R46DRAFT_1056610 [Mycena filopes]